MQVPQTQILKESSVFRSMMSTLMRRLGYGLDGRTFQGKRNIYDALGYDEILRPAQLRARYIRNSVAGRIVDAYPESTWRGEVDVFEDSNPQNFTPFETAWEELVQRLKIWATLQQADQLSGLGRYSILVIGGPGKSDTPLPKGVNSKNIAYLRAYSEEHAAISDWVTNDQDPRFGQPLFYTVKQIGASSDMIGFGASAPPVAEGRVHHSRVIHLAEKRLGDNVFSTPRLQRCWNNLDDLDKVIGGGAEAFWLTAHQGYQFDLDKDVQFAEGEESKLKDEVDEFVHGMRRSVRTRGVKMKAFGSDTANMSESAGPILDLLSAGSEIPQRILLGSERGQLASEQDRANWAERVQNRRKAYAEVFILRPLVDLLLDCGALPKPKTPYIVTWPEVRDMSGEERANYGVKLAQINKTNMTTVVGVDEIRTISLGLQPRTEEQKKEFETQDAAAQASAAPFGGSPSVPNKSVTDPVPEPDPGKVPVNDSKSTTS